jgi:thioester reductase-like protein
VKVVGEGQQAPTAQEPYQRSMIVQVKKIYLLVRGKKQHAASKRVDTLLCGPLFHLLHKEAAAGKRNVFSKVQAMEGDLTKPDLGLSAEDLRTLQQEVGIILHSGANIELEADVQMTLK